MNATERNQMRAEAFKNLETYLKTGIDGFRVKGIDRLKALGIRTEACEGTREGIQHLVDNQIYIG
jgi:hypothetical protein